MLGYGLDLPDDWWEDSYQIQRVLDHVLRPVLVGTGLSLALCGILLAIALRFFGRFGTRDPWGILVVICSVVAVADTVNQSVWIVDWTMRWGQDVRLLTKMRTELGLYTVSTGTCVWLAQCTFCWRLFIISQRRAFVLCGSIAASQIAATGLGYWFIVHTFHSASIFDFLSSRERTIAYLFLCLLADSLITGGTVYYLIVEPKRSNDGMIKTNSRLFSLALQSVRTNALSAAVHLTLVALLFAGQGLDYVYVAFIVPKVYLVSTILTLLTRPRPCSRSPCPPTRLARPVIARRRSPRDPARSMGFFSMLHLDSQPVGDGLVRTRSRLSDIRVVVDQCIESSEDFDAVPVAVRQAAEEKDDDGEKSPAASSSTGSLKPKPKQKKKNQLKPPKRRPPPPPLVTRSYGLASGTFTTTASSLPSSSSRNRSHSLNLSHPTSPTVYSPSSYNPTTSACTFRSVQSERSRIAPFALEEEVVSAVEAELERERDPRTVTWEEAEKRMHDLV